VSGSALATHLGQTYALSSLFGVNDAEGDTPTSYQFQDVSAAKPGTLLVNGTAAVTNQIVTLTPVQVGQATFQWNTGPGQSLRSRVRWRRLECMVSCRHALQSYSGRVGIKRRAEPRPERALSSLFAASGADGDAIASYQVVDKTTALTSGHFVIGGQSQLARPGTVAPRINLTPAQQAQATFQAGFGSDDIMVRAFDGHDWSGWTTIHVSEPAADKVPVVTTFNATGSRGQTFFLSDLFTASDADGDPIVAYIIADNTPGATSGELLLNGKPAPSPAVT
jgi:hypothetical protein